MIPDLPSTDQLPGGIQAILNIIGFLIASAAVWYAYFVKGKDRLTADANKPEQDLTITPYDAKAFRNLCEDVQNIKFIKERMEGDVHSMKLTMEKVYEVLKHDSDEQEIRRRVEEQLALVRSNKNKGRGD